METPLTGGFDDSRVVLKALRKNAGTVFSVFRGSGEYCLNAHELVGAGLLAKAVCQPSNVELNAAFASKPAPTQTV
ncbi:MULTISPECIES: hypothetical protein [Pseudomonas]|uniref:hypothetical protein n=1 Tax=Pseudomonas TaxID=286 RepID=UPI001BEB641A|nr:MULTISPECIES: hypothetical protein [Pseudomonas]MBT2340062.1 hypothetical protein [Pseudomonas fluorescens]MCD4531493.1 hypothetical protein [Pseudomonas sp. C3-2018]